MVVSESIISEGEQIIEIVNNKRVKEKTYLQRLVNTLRENLSVLSAKVTNEQLEFLAVLIQESMSSSSRVFHSVNHVFDISVDADEITTLSALFHDVIYYNVDGGLSPKQSEILNDVISEEGMGRTPYVKLNLIDSYADPLLAMVAAIFGLSSGQILNPFGGLNEFLSAVVAVRVLPLQPAYLAQIAACIEGTIPFRTIDSKGRTPADILYDRMIASNCNFQLGMTEKEIIDTIHRSVDLSNRDIGNFASPDAGCFLDQTWKLIPETNEHLRQKSLYSVFDYYIAL
eukprot:6482791-Ditylum_brightwellii.AAC.1